MYCFTFSVFLGFSSCVSLSFFFLFFFFFFMRGEGEGEGLPDIGLGGRRGVLFFVFSWFLVWFHFSFFFSPCTFSVSWGRFVVQFPRHIICCKFDMFLFVWIIFVVSSWVMELFMWKKVTKSLFSVVFVPVLYVQLFLRT